MNIQFNSAFRPSYQGQIKGIVLDWSGTTADAYVLAPALVFVKVFQKYGVEISVNEARGPMGLRKDLHIKALTETAALRQRWQDAYGREPNQQDVDKMFQDFVAMQLDCIREYTKLLPYVADITQSLQQQGIKIGSSTGFVRSIVNILEEEAEKQGYVPDASVAGDDVENGVRPKPFMVYRNLDLMDVHPIQSAIKVDDTVSGIGEALEAGCWGVGIARYSNYMDIDSLKQADYLPENEIQKRLTRTRRILRKAGAHYVIDTFDQLPDVVQKINRRLEKGDRP